jgi:hypothetical protein
MPDKINLFLQTLSDEDADEIWIWLDGNPDCVMEMIEVLLDSHHNLDESL